MHIQFGLYTIRTHELDNKLVLQVTSATGKVSIKDSEEVYPYDFPNGIHFQIEDNDNTPMPKGLKRYKFGDYSFIVGINNSGLLSLFYSKKLYVKRKLIDDIDTLTFAFLQSPTQTDIV